MPTRFLVFLIDDLDLTPASFHQAVAAAGRQLRALLPGDRAAVLSASGRIATEFSGEQDKLLTALAKISPMPPHESAGTCPAISYHQADLIVNGQDTIATEAAVREVMVCMPQLAIGGSSQAAIQTGALLGPTSSSPAQQFVESAARAALSIGEQGARLAISGLLDAIRRLEVMAGERRVVLVSPGFLKSGVQKEVSNATRRAIQANVTIHAIDARGLWADPGGPAEGTAFDAEASRIKSSLASEAANSASGVMAEVSAGSGGRLFQNGNSLDTAFHQATAVPEYRYVLSFAPQSLKPDGKFHTLKVSLKGARGLSVEARKGYFAPLSDPDSNKQAKQDIRAEVFSRNERNDLTVDVATRVTGEPAKGSSQPKYALTVFTRLDLKTLEFRRAGGRYLNNAQNVAALFDANGNMVAGNEQLAAFNFTAKELEQHRETGAVFRADFDLAPGAYLLRVVSRDSEGHRLASRNEAITVPALEGGTQSGDKLLASLAGAKKKPAVAWKATEAPAPEPEEPEEPLSPTIDMVPVPGGLAAMARIVNLSSEPSPEKFFLLYCRAIENLVGSARPGGVLPPVASVASAVAGVVELSRFAERESGRIHLSLDSANERERTIRALQLLGWNATQNGEFQSGAGSARLDANRKFSIEPGDAVADSSRQEASAALGIDEIAMVNALAARQPYAIVVPSGEAQFIQARLWTKLAGTLPPGGFVELFARRPELATAYAGLAAMNLDAANAVISAVGLRPLVEKYANTVRMFGESFAVSEGRVVVPGGAPAQPVWEKLAGASTQNPKAFFRALIRKDAGWLAGFYFAIWQGDPAHRRFFTADRARAARFYAWYRGEHVRNSVRTTWQEELLRGLPLDDAGRVRFPGGRLAWTSSTAPDDEALLSLASLRALVPVARIEQARKAPLDAESARLLSAHYAAWRALFPYFEQLKCLGAAEFGALERFEEAVSKAPRPDRNAIMGQWHSLVKLAELAARAGSLDDAAAARAFRRACEALSAADVSTAATAVLLDMAGHPADPDEAVPAALLRLDERRRAAFYQVKELLRVPSISLAAGPTGRSLPVLAGLVYAATLDPDSVLIVEDAGLLARHQFTDSDAACGLFCPSKCKIRPGSALFQGGFAGFEAEARIATRERIRRVDGAAAWRRAAAPAASGSGTGADFQVSSRVVEANATVANGNGSYVDGLRQSDFRVLDNGKPVSLSAFEKDTSAVSVALLLDMSTSMTPAIATLRKSAFSLLDNLRPIDPVAVFGFNDSVSELQPWTLDKDAAKRALLHASVMGGTELHDALLRLIHELSDRKGRNVIVVFTDGADTASALGVDAVERRAKENSIRIYTVAEGEALASPELLSGLKTIATSTGGLSLVIRQASEMAGAFTTISRDLAHGYLLAIRAESDPSGKWHNLDVVLTSPHGRRVRARQGYFGTP